MNSKENMSVKVRLVLRSGGGGGRRRVSPSPPGQLIP